MKVGRGATAEQAAVIDAPLTARLFVVAGPGAGKTWTLLQRAANLRERDGLAVDEVLMLSFTRAVVQELRRRDRELENRSRVRPETFDSFASRLLRAHASDERWRSSGFDGRIAAATRLIEEGAAAETVARTRHILVDEVQDLVGVRAAFVAALLDAHEGGVTAFGDPAQAIYDHECGDDGDPLIEVIGSFCDATCTIPGNRRYGGRRATRTEELRSVLTSSGRQGGDAVWRECRGLASVGDVALAGQTFVRPELTAAILCRDNATALELSDALHRRGVDHRVRRSSTDRPVAGWVAAVMAGRSSVTEQDVQQGIDRLPPGMRRHAPDPAGAWDLLRRLDTSARGGALQEREIRTSIAIGRVPWELHDQDMSSLSVSTIHRAKGLEFDDVLIVEWDPPLEESDEEARVLFVALTRARRDTWVAEFEGTRRWYRSDDAAGRLVKRGNKHWQTFGIELWAADVLADEPGGSLIARRDPREVQELLLGRVEIGDEVELRYAGDHDLGRGAVPVYGVHHLGLGLIGVTGNDLGTALRRRLGGPRRPQAITGVRIEGIDTVVGPPEVAEEAGLGRAGLWLRPRLIGLGEFEWT